MGLFSRRASRLERVLARHELKEAMGRVEAEQSGYRHVRTFQGRTAHLQQSPPGVLCGGWRGPWIPAEPELPVCRMCSDELERLSKGEVA